MSINNFDLNLISLDNNNHEKNSFIRERSGTEMGPSLDHNG